MRLSRCSTDLREYMKRSVCVHLSRVWSSISYLAISFSGFPFYKGQSEFVFEMNLSYRLGFLLSSIPIGQGFFEMYALRWKRNYAGPRLIHIFIGIGVCNDWTRIIYKVLYYLWSKLFLFQYMVRAKIMIVHRK